MSQDDEINPSPATQLQVQNLYIRTNESEVRITTNLRAAGT